METFPSQRDDSDRAAITPLSDEAIYQGENAAAARARERLTRRSFLRRSILAVGGLSATAALAGALYMLYPTMSEQFGGLIDVGSREDFLAATPEQFKLNHMGVFYHDMAKAFIVHLARETQYLMTDSLLAAQMADEQFVRDSDGSCWLALYQRCTHLGTTMVFRNYCARFDCPSHGAQYHCDGEYLSGPAPRSMDRFPLSIQNDHILIDTSRLTLVPRPIDEERILPVPLVPCSA